MSRAWMGSMAVVLALSGCAMMQKPSPPPAPRLPVVYLLFFHGSSADLTPAAKVIVDQAAAKVRETPPSTVALAGYTADIGTPAAQKERAEQRIRTVEAALTADGVDPKLFLRIPLGDADDNAGATGDRRIEIRLTYNN